MNWRPVTLNEIVSRDQFSEMLEPLPDVLGDLQTLRVGQDLLGYWALDHGSVFSIFPEEFGERLGSVRGAILSDQLAVEDDDYEESFRLTKSSQVLSIVDLTSWCSHIASAPF